MKAIKELYKAARRERCAVTTWVDEEGRSWAVIPDEAWRSAEWGEDGRHGKYWIDLMGQIHKT